MSIFEIKTWGFRCDSCGENGPVVLSQRQPALPADWSTKMAHDCGMTGYSARRIYCGDCARRSAAADPEGAMPT